MKKKGFTLVELLAVIALLAILTMIAVPNVLSTINNRRRNTFLLDAKRMVTKAEYLVSEDRTIRDTIKEGTPKTFTITELNIDGEFPSDSDGLNYDINNTYVTVSFQDSIFKYCIKIVGGNRNIQSSSGGCIDSSTLTGIEVVKDN